MPKNLDPLYAAYCDAFKKWQESRDLNEEQIIGSITPIDGVEIDRLVRLARYPPKLNEADLLETYSNELASRPKGGRPRSNSRRVDARPGNLPAQKTPPIKPPLSGGRLVKPDRAGDPAPSIKRKGDGK